MSVIEKNPFVIMAKPVGPVCNLSCSYCYYTKTADFYENKHDYMMSDSMLETFIKKYIEASPGPVVNFTWHGGEPSLAGLDFYRLAVNLQKKYLPKDWECWNNIQTNGLLLDDEWCSFLADEHFDVGLSIDGTKWLHDEYRKDKAGKGTYDSTVNAVKRLQSHGIQPDLLCTVTSSIAKEPLAVYRTLKNLGTGWIQFIPIVRRNEDGTVTNDSVTGKMYGEFLCAVFDEWVRYDINRLNVQIFAETSLMLTGNPTNLCQLSPACGRVMVIEHDGSVYSCDHFVKPENRIGDITESDLSSLVETAAQLRFGIEKKEGLTKQCMECEYLAFCNGGCLKERFDMSISGEKGHNYLCEGYKMFFSHSLTPLIRINEMRKEEIKPAVIMNQIRAELFEEWKNIGRNDLCPCGSGKKAKKCCLSGN